MDIIHKTILDSFHEKHIAGLTISPNATHPTYQIDIAIGTCKSDDDERNLILTSPITIDITASGENGLDTGSEAASSWYYVWLIYNPTTDTYKGLFSLSSTSPTLPEGYVYKRRIGVVRNSVGSDFLNFRMIGNGVRRRYEYNEDRYGVLRVLSNGTATIWTDIDVSSVVPPTAIVLIIEAHQSGTPNGQLRDDGYSFDSGQWIVRPGSSSDQISIINVGQTIEYKNSGAGSSFYVDVLSFEEDL